MGICRYPLVSSDLTCTLTVLCLFNKEETSETWRNLLKVFSEGKEVGDFELSVVVTLWIL